MLAQMEASQASPATQDGTLGGSPSDDPSEEVVDSDGRVISDDEQTPTEVSTPRSQPRAKRDRSPCGYEGCISVMHRPAACPRV